MTGDIDSEALSMIYALLDDPIFADSRIRIMPDVHAGKGIVIGFTCPVSSAVSPSHVGVDIGCGIDLELFDRPLSPSDYALFEHRLRRDVPTGNDLREKRTFEMKTFLRFLRSEYASAVQGAHGLVGELDLEREADLERWLRGIGMDTATFYKSLGTLGGGNHFMEYDEGEGRYAFTVHTGSRALGMKVFAKWDNLARKNPNHPGYLEGEDMRGYLADMVLSQAYAKFNRTLILEEAAAIIHKITKASVTDMIRTTHNYVDFSDMILRKGAIRSYSGERMVIPFNMRDGLAVCEGLSNAQWNFSAPHGAGRRLSRAAAKRELDIEEFRLQMKDVYSTSVAQSTLDEVPGAYKDSETILSSLAETGKVLYRMWPKVNVKATKWKG